MEMIPLSRKHQATIRTTATTTAAAGIKNITG